MKGGGFRERESWQRAKARVGRQPKRGGEESVAVGEAAWTVMAESGEWESVGSPDSSNASSPASSVQSPAPLTPLFSPSSTSSHSPASSETDAAAPDLTPDLIRAGWRKCYSSREKKHYYFNKLTQQSLWEMPTLESSSGGRKRAAASKDPGQPYKKFIPSSDWDLVLETNVHMGERVPLDILPTLPECEGRRLEAIGRLRSLFNDLNRTSDGVDVPLDWLPRWIMERKLADAGLEPLLPHRCSSPLSPLLFRDLLACVPIRSHHLRNVPEARKHAGKYAEAAKRLAEKSRTMSNDERKQVKWQCEAMFDFLRQSAGNTKFEEFLNRLTFLKTQIGSILSEAGKSGAESAARKLGTASAEAAATLQETQRETLEAAGLPLSEEPLPAARTDKVVRCYPAQLRYGTPRSSAVVAMEQSPSGYVKLTCRYTNNSTQAPSSIKLNAAHFFKLEQLYRINSFDDRRFDLFLIRVWSMLRRYQCLFGPGEGEGAALHRSLPVPVFELLKRQFGATLEAFASPLNCYFRQFCSLFPDTDGYFGSRGKFQDFIPLDGSIVVHPPAVEEVMETAVEWVLGRLEDCSSSERPLAFFLVLPETEERREATDQRLSEAGHLLRLRRSLPSHDVAWRHGAQHSMPANAPDSLYRSHTGLLLYWMANDAAADKWPLSTDRGDSLLAAFAPPPNIPPSPAAALTSPRPSY